MENFDNIINKVLMDRLSVNQEDIIDSAHFANDLGADSLDMVEVILEFEKEFDLLIPDEVVDEIKTVADAKSYLKEKLEK